MDRTALNRRFHALLHNLGIMDRKEDILSGYGVSSTRDLTDVQLSEIIDRLSMEKQLRGEAALRRSRSIALSLLTDLGVYYASPGESKRARWERVDSFVRSPKLTGKCFYDLNTMELDALARKLRSMRDRGYCYRRPDLYGDQDAEPPSADNNRDKGRVHVFMAMPGNTIGPVN